VVADPSTPTNTNHWPTLSNEMVLFILRHLSLKDLAKVSLINKEFRDFSRDDSLWTELTLDYEDIKQNAESCRKLVERCKKLANLKISNDSRNWLPLNIMTVVIRAKESLRSLEVHLSMTTWSPAAMAKLGQMKNLTSLTLEVNTDAKQVYSYEGAKILEEIAKLDKLEVLNLGISHSELDRMDHWIQSRINSLPIMKSVFQSLKKLKILKMYVPASDFDETLVTTLATNNPDLTGLRFMNYPSLSEESVDLLASSCPGLQELNICFRDGASEINKLSSSFPNLKHLFVMCFGSDDEQLIKFGEKFRRLERLEFIDNVASAITDSGVERIVGTAKNLKYLRLDWAPKVTKDIVERLRMEYPDLDLRIGLY